MTEIIASILSPGYTYEDMKNKIAKLRGLISTVQIDLCDGVFVPNKTWPFVSGGLEDYNFKRIINGQEGLPFWEDINFELDLMVSDAVENFDIYMKLGPKGVIFHIEAMADLEDFKDFLEGIDIYIRDVIKIGIAINPSTALEKIFPFISIIDFVQLMGNDKIGVSGVSLDGRVYGRIKLLREKYPDLSIEIDIGVNKETAPLLVKAGASRLVAGSAIFNTDNIIDTIEKFKALD